MLRWCRSCRICKDVLAVNINFRSEGNARHPDKQLTRYPCFPRRRRGRGGGIGGAMRTPGAGSRRLFLSVDFIFSKLLAVEKIVRNFLYHVFAHLGCTPRFLLQGISKRGRGPVPYALNLDQWYYHLPETAPIVHSHTSVLLIDIVAQIIDITAVPIMIRRRGQLPWRLINIILSYICFPGTWQTLDIEHTCNLIRYAVYTVIVENRKTWGIDNMVVA